MSLEIRTFEFEWLLLSIGVMTFKSKLLPADLSKSSTCFWPNHLKSTPEISTIKSPSFMPPNWKKKSGKIILNPLNSRAFS